MKKQKNETKKDDFNAKLAFYLSLGFWIPLFNIGLCIISLVLAFKSLKAIDQDGKSFSGKGYAIMAIIISSTALVFTLLFAGIFMNKYMSCQNLPNIF